MSSSETQVETHPGIGVGVMILKDGQILWMRCPRRFFQPAR